MRKITFVTTNVKKVQEVNALLRKYNVLAVQECIDYPEDKEHSVDEVCKKASMELSTELNKELIVEDTGLFFKAYDNFPGPMPKFLYNGVGFEGIFRLLEGVSREAYFRSVFGYCQPGQAPVIFSAEVHGVITKEVLGSESHGKFMPYDRIFIPDGMKKVIAEMTVEEKNNISQRGKLTHQLGKFLTINT